jgi:hypothetical protein
MPLDPEGREFLKRLFARLSEDALMPGDPLYEPLYDNPDTGDPVALMRDLIDVSKIESFQLFSGFRGTGKTTELWRLRHELQALGYFVIYADALDYINPAEPIDVSNLLMALAGAFGDELERQIGANIAKETVWARFMNFLETKVSLKEAAVKIEAESPAKGVIGGGKASVDLRVELKSDSPFRQKLKHAFETRPREFKDQVNSFFAEGVRQIRKAKGAETRVVFIFDQLEQMRGTLESEEAVIRSVERIFSINIDLLKLQYIHAVYTVPPWLKFLVLPNVTMRILPTIHLWRNDLGRSRDEPSWTAYRALVHRRLEESGLQRLFGARPAAENETVDRLIEMSGGQFRDILRLLREVVLRSMSLPSLPTTPAVVMQAVNAVRSDFLPIAQEDAKWLDIIARGRATALPDTEPKQVMRLARFLDTHSVLFFKNADEWYDVHPLIRGEIAKVLATLPERAV